MANAEAEWRQLLQLIQQDRKQRVRCSIHAPLSYACSYILS